MSWFEDVLGTVERGAEVYDKLVSIGAITPAYQPQAGMTIEEFLKRQEALIKAMKGEEAAITEERPAWEKYLPWAIGLGSLAVIIPLTVKLFK